MKVHRSKASEKSQGVQSRIPGAREYNLKGADMKFLYVLVVLPLIALGWVDDSGRDSSIPSGPSPVADAVISLTLANTFTVPDAQQMLGLDCQPTLLALLDNTGDELMGVNWTTGSQNWVIPINYGGTMVNFGCAHTYPIPWDWYINAWSDGSFHLYDPGTTSWSVPFSNPAGTAGRGMAYDDPQNEIWETDGASGVWRIDDPSGNGTFYDTPEVPSQMSGLAIFPYGGELWIVVTIYAAPEFYFYSFTGSSLVYQGMDDLSMTSFDLSLGLAYCQARDSFFWSYEVYGGNPWIAELDYSIAALQQSTWGTIKSQF